MDVNVFWVANHIAYTTVAHTHEFYHMILCRQKGGKITIGETEYKAKTDHIYFVKPGVMHSMHRGSDMQLTEIKFIVSDDRLNSYLANLPAEFFPEDILFMKTVFTKVVKEALGDQPFCSDAANCAVKLFLIQSLRQFDKNSALSDTQNNSFNTFEAPEYAKSNGDVMILGLKKHIENNIKNDITLESLAERVGFNKTYFIKRFKILWGITPMQFVNNVRLELAKKLLITSDMSVTQISEQCGYKSLHYFSRSFKSNNGISPSEYIKKHK